MSECYLRPLTFGGITIENNLFQAPLAGYSSAPFRLLSWRLGRPGLLATEMISARALELEVPRQGRYLERYPGEGPVAYQLWGATPEAVGVATRVVSESGADVIDLNCGCPVRKVRAANAGSKLMEDPPLIGRLVKAMRASTEKPVTIKIRVGTGPEAYNGAEIARIAEGEGADLITVHGRHAKESYGTPVRVGEIAKVVAAVKIPVIGNGDVKDGASAPRLFAETGCAGVMVGRACMGGPWVFARLRAELSGEAWVAPDWDEVGRVFLEHYDLMAELLGGDLAVRHCRKLGAFYSRAMPGAKAFRDGLNHCHRREDLAALAERHFFIFS